LGGSSIGFVGGSTSLAVGSKISFDTGGSEVCVPTEGVEVVVEADGTTSAC